MGGAFFCTSAGGHEVSGCKESIEGLPANAESVLIETLGPGIRKIGDRDRLDNCTISFSKLEDPFVVFVEVEKTTAVDTLHFKSNLLIQTKEGRKGTEKSIAGEVGRTIEANRVILMTNVGRRKFKMTIVLGEDGICGGTILGLGRCYICR